MPESGQDPEVDSRLTDVDESESDIQLAAHELLSRGLLEAQRLFEVIGIDRLICVDDVASRDGSDLKTLVTASVRDSHVSLEKAKELLKKYECPDDLDSLDAEELADALMNETIDVPRGALLAMQGAAIQEGGERGLAQTDESSVGILQQIAVDAGLQFVLVDLDTWYRHRDEYVKPRTMILFDKDMTADETGTKETGEQLLLSVAESAPTGVLAGLFTESVAPGGEYDAWKSLSLKYPGHADRLLVVSKGVVDARDPRGLVSALKLLSTAPRLASLVSSIKTLYLSKAEESLGALQDLSPYTLDRLFVGAIEDEGEWGPEVFASYVNAGIRTRVSKALRETATLTEDISQLRHLASLEANLPAPSRDELRSVQRMKKLEDGHINEVFLPIEAGDLFQFFKVGTEPTDPWAGHLWLLVTQQCDLAIRGSTGIRNNNPPFLTVMKLEPVSSEDVSAINSRYSYGLPFLEAPDGLTYIARILVIKRVPAIALDLCSYNADGRSWLSVVNPPDVPGLSSASSSALDRNLAAVGVSVERYAHAQSKTTDTDVLRTVLSGLTLASAKPTGFEASVDPETKTLRFGVRRIARLKEPVILDIVDQLAASQGRVALDAELDFGGL